MTKGAKVTRRLVDSIIDIGIMVIWIDRWRVCWWFQTDRVKRCERIDWSNIVRFERAHAKWTLPFSNTSDLTSRAVKLGFPPIVQNLIIFDGWKPQDAHAKAAEYYQVCNALILVWCELSLMTAGSLTGSTRQLRSKRLLLLHAGWVSKASILILQVLTKRRNYRQTTSHTTQTSVDSKVLVQEEGQEFGQGYPRCDSYDSDAVGRDHAERLGRDDDCGWLWAEHVQLGDTSERRCYVRQLSMVVTTRANDLIWTLEPEGQIIKGGGCEHDDSNFYQDFPQIPTEIWHWSM